MKDLFDIKASANDTQQRNELQWRRWEMVIMLIALILAACSLAIGIISLAIMLSASGIILGTHLVIGG